jgi:exodeoxyribonuclease VII small subunit
MAARKDTSEEPSFEKAMERLEAILAEMEGGKLTLEQLLERYEEGVKLSRICSSKLDAAEKRIQQIVRDSSGSLTLEAFDEAKPTPNTPEESNEVSLF